MSTMVPEEVYQQEQCAVEDRALLLALQQNYEQRTKDNKRKREKCKQCLLALGVDPRTGRSNHRGTKHLMSIGKGVRTQKRVKNKFSSEEAGTISKYTAVMRWDNSYITKVVKRPMLW